MRDMLNMVDVVVELRDARAPQSTTHPSLPSWVGGRGHVLAVNRIDTVPERALTVWENALRDTDGPKPYFVDARKGRGVPELKRAIIEAGKKVNERRKRRGINPRPVRAAILGYPNVGKSALINRLVSKRKAKTENRPGVTRNFMWVKIDPQVALLDSPGIIPAKAVKQSAAYHLAMCNDIGSAAYDTRYVAEALVERLLLVGASQGKGFAQPKILAERWGVPLYGPTGEGSGEDYLARLAEARFTGDIERAAVSLLKDFRSGRLGPICIEWPNN
jgi:ribosome biogenesis GTPase A